MGGWRLRQIGGIKPFKSDDPDSERIFWQEGGVHQNLTSLFTPIPSAECTAGINAYESNARNQMTSTETSW